VTSDVNQLLRRLPKIDEVLKLAPVQAIDLPRWAVVEAVRRAVDERRRAILAGESTAVDIDTDEVATLAAALVSPSLRQVVNATGVVVHTNFGRAPLAPAAAARIAELSSGYSNLEYDLDQGKRGSRHSHLTELLCALTGAEDAVVVNNNAGAVMLCLAAFAADREVIVSRGELIEIGGSFRIPDVMRLSGAQLVEVGTTNKTHLHDYQGAITSATALLLKVHQSNFAIVGFTAEVEAAELVDLGSKFSIPTMLDLGSGCLLEAETSSALGLPAEPSVRSVVATGLDLVSFSGDKLLGGPQAGIIVGRAEAVARVRTHQMMRALRPGKLNLAALETTLSIYRDGHPTRELPVLAMLASPLAQLRTRAENLRSAIAECPEWLAVEVISCESTVGGGAMPTSTLPSWGLGLTSSSPDINVGDIEKRLRGGPVPVVGRIVDDELVLDVRTLARDSDLALVVAAIKAL
jgi:L-seryl-tRNA(Ser) seleniumtransferase